MNTLEIQEMKLACLQLAMKQHPEADEKKVIEAAKAFYDFVSNTSKN